MTETGEETVRSIGMDGPGKAEHPAVVGRIHPPEDSQGLHGEPSERIRTDVSR